MRHDWCGAADKQPQQFVDQPVLSGVARDNRLENVGVADLLDALQGFLCFEAIDRGLHRRVGRPVARWKRLLNLANGEGPAVPERLHDLQLELGELWKGDIAVL